MENATKALLIAASILIVIVLISVGIRILGSTSEVTDQVDAVSESMASSVFNSQFQSYVGESVSGSRAKELLYKLMSHNSSIDSDTFSAKKHHVYLSYYPNPTGGAGLIRHKWTPSEIQNIYSKISDTSTYKIVVNNGCTEYSNGYYNGYIICIIIRKMS